jgi:Delta7-sterol 5-desaturase
MSEPLCPFQLALQAWPTIWVADLLRYLIPAGLLSAVLALVPLAWRAPRSVRDRQPASGQRRREVMHSLSTVLLFSANGALIVAGVQAGVLAVYTDWHERGTWYALASLVLLIALHDTWFYWTHRLLHWRGIFGRVHLTHHRSLAPTPWAAYSFSVGEAAVQAVFLGLVLLALPLHPMVIAVFLTHMIVRNVQGHSGVELLPAAWLAGWWGRWLTTTLHHDMHHATGRHNYGLYFTWWDRLCGTEHPLYRTRLAELIEKMRADLQANSPKRGYRKA